MSTKDIEFKALQLEPKARARLAGKLLESLEDLTDEENAQLWAEEAARRDADLDGSTSGRPADDVLQEARNHIE